MACAWNVAAEKATVIDVPSVVTFVIAIVPGGGGQPKQWS
jgi:hypothetical protein